MKGVFLAFVLCGVAAPVSAGGAASTDIDSFLKRLGFEDYSARIKDSLEKGRALNGIGADALRINARRYEMVSQARRLGTEMLTQAYPRLRETEFRGRFLEFAAHLLTLKPTAPPLDLPRPVTNGGPQATDSFLEDVARANIRRQSEALMAEYDAVLRPRVASRRAEIAALMDRYVERLYLDAQIGNTQWLGRALVLGLARYAEKEEDPAVLVDLRAAVSARGLFLENYLGSTLILSGAEGTRRVKVKTGDLIFERSREIKESAAITAVALPQDEEAARRQGLAGSLLDAAWDVSEEDRADGLSWIQRQKLIAAQSDRFSRGMSHVAQLAVYRDPATGIEQTLIWDDYPYSIHLDVDKDEEWGGVRLNGFEHFANPGQVMRVGVVTVDSKRLFQLAKKRLAAVRREGWRREAWPSYRPRINESREILPQERPARQDWEYQLSEADFYKFHGLDDREAWLKEYQRRLVAGWKTMMTDWGVWFYWIDAGAGRDARGIFQPGRYWYGGMYCSQAVDFASLLFTGLDLEVRPSHYAPSLAWIQRTGLKKARQLDLKAPVIAPVSLALQPYSDPLIQVVYPPYGLAALARFGFQDAAAPVASPSRRAAAESPWDTGERKALIARERKFIEFVSLESGKSPKEIFGKGFKTAKNESEHASLVELK